jgi:hypothetical protein
MHFVDIVLVFGGLVAAGAVGVVGVLGLVVWLAGGKTRSLKKE